MDAVRDVCSAALSLRKAKGLRVRLPLPALTVATPRAEELRPFVDLVADEVNVKSVELTGDLAGHCEQVLTLVPRVLGPRLGGQVQQVIRAVKAGDWSLVDGRPVAAGVTLADGEYELRQVASDAEHSAALPGEGVVVLDTEVTPELAAEGLARDVVRAVQQARRDAGLDVSDRITLVLGGDDEVRTALHRHHELVAREVLAASVDVGDTPAGRIVTAPVGDGREVRLALSRA